MSLILWKMAYLRQLRKILILSQFHELINNSSVTVPLVNPHGQAILLMEPFVLDVVAGNLVGPQGQTKPQRCNKIK